MGTKKKSKKAVAKKTATKKAAQKTTKPAAYKLTAEEPTQSPEFMYVPTGTVMALEQVRSNINAESDSFKALMQSIKDRGVLEPLLVRADDAGQYVLLCGERRLMAALQLGLESVPVRIMNTASEQDQVLAYQLTENLQREDLNPIDQAQGILSYIQAKLPDNNYDADGVMGELVNVMRTPDYASQAFSATVAETLEIVGKSIKTMYNGLSLLKLPSGIRTAVADGTLPVSQGYLFAANLDCPDCDKIFEAVKTKPVTNAALTNLLTAWKKPKPDTNAPRLVSLAQKVSSLKSWRATIEQSTASYKPADLQTFLDELQALVSAVQQRMQPAPPA